MKKLFILLTALLTLGAGGAWAQDASVHTGVNYYWRLYDTANSKARYIKTDATKVNGSESTTGAGTFQLEDAGDGYYYIHEMTTNKYVYTTEAAAITNLSYTESGSVYSNNAQVLSTGAKADTDYFKWKLSAGTRGGCFFISSKANSNAVIAAMSQGDTKVNFYQKSGGYAFANSQFLPVNDASELARATATINSGSSYRIFTKNNGSSEGDTKYYLTTSGTLTNSDASAGLFTFTATTTSNYVAAGNAWFITYGDNTKYFTNPEMADRENKIKQSSKTTETRRQDWDAQVLYKNEAGLFAIRATNAVTSTLTWHPAVYWIVEDNENTLPDADYSIDFEDRSYVWQLEKPITYKLLWNEEPIASCTKTIYQSVGDAAIAASDASMFGAAPAYCNYSAASVSIIGKETTEVTYTLTWDGPFDFSTSFNTATWYYMAVGGEYAVSNGDTNCPTYAEQQTGDAAWWAFVGNPYDGFKIVNYASGSANSLSVEGTCKMNNSVYYKTCFLDKSNNKLYIYNDPNDPYYLLLSGHQVGAGDKHDTYSVITVEAVDFQALALDFIDDYADSHAVGQYYGVDQSSVNTWTETFTTNGCDVATYKALTTYTSSYLTTKTVSTGYYRIKSNSGRYMAYGQPSSYTPGLITVASAEAMTNASTVIKLEQKPAVRTKFKIITEGWAARGMQTANTAFPVTDSGDDTYFTFVAASGNPGKATICQEESNNDENVYVNGYLHEAGWDIPGVVNWAADAASSQWEIEDATTVTITLHEVDGKYYGTMYLPFAVTLPTPSPGNGVFACLISITANNRAQLTSLYNRSIPANTPVLLYGQGCGTSINVTITAGADAIEGDNDLAGTFFDKTTLADNEYVLATKTVNGVPELGFWKLGSGAKVGANKAYLVVPGGSVKGFSLDFSEVTGLSEIAGSTQKAQIFDLSGRRVNEPARGLYIVNGKKVLVK